MFKNISPSIFSYHVMKFSLIHVKRRDIPFNELVDVFRRSSVTLIMKARDGFNGIIESSVTIGIVHIGDSG